MRARKKKRKVTAPRTRNWRVKHEDAFTHDRSRNVKAEAAAPASAATPRELPPGAEPNGVVVSHSGQWATVRMAREERLCLVDAALGEEESSILAPGDGVLVEFQDEDAIVRSVAQRRSKLSRLAHIHSRLQEQVVAANVDYLVVIGSARHPRFKPGVVDRYLVAADTGGVTTMLVVNKMDLVDAEPSGVESYRALGMSVFATSCVDGRGLDALHAALRGKLSVLAGQSGVGKSSLINRMAPSLNIATQEVSSSNEKGRHTTTTAQLYELEGGVRIIDTPGIRQLGLWDVTPEELAFYFPEIAELAAGCRFRDCSHIHEPHCAVQTAVESGDIAKGRYDSYLRIRASL